MKIGTIGIESELLQAMVQSELEVVAIAKTTESLIPDAIGCRPDLFVSTSHFQLVRNPIVDAVVLAVDSSDRFFLAHEALKAGKHVLVDSQLSRTLEEAVFLEAFARSQECVLVSGHPALRSQAVRRARTLLRENEGRLRVLTSRRSWPESEGRDVDGLWDRVACDVALFDLLIDAHPTWVSTVATSPDAGAALDSLHLTLHYETPHGSVLGQIELCDGADRESGSVAATADGLRLDLHERDACQIDLEVNGEPQPLPTADPRIEMYRHFAACVNTNGVLDGPDPGLAVAHTLDAARRSLHAGGRAAEV